VSAKLRIFQNKKGNLLTQLTNINEDTCDICRLDGEDANHIILWCPFAQTFWTRIGWNPDTVAAAQELLTSTAPHGVPKEALPTKLLLCCWEL
jgi:hypothetical protein